MKTQLVYSPSLSRPRNPQAINPYADVEYAMQGNARLIFRRTRAKHASASQGQGKRLVQVIAGWNDDPELEAAIASWEPDHTMSIYQH